MRPPPVKGASALPPSYCRRGIAALVPYVLIAAAAVALAQMTNPPVAISPHAHPWAPTASARVSLDTPPPTAPAGAPTSWSGSATASTTTTTEPPTAPTTAATPLATPGPQPVRSASAQPSPAPVVPAYGHASAWGCTAALAYLHAYAAPDFALECPGDAEGHEGMTCMSDPIGCPSGAVIAIAEPCAQTYMNEASNSWVLTGQSDAPIDPYGACS